MKVLIVTPYFYPKIGGMENYAFNIAKGLSSDYGHNITVVTSNHKENKYSEEVLSGLKIIRLPIWFKLSNTPVNPLWFFHIKKLIKEFGPDVIMAHTPVPFISDLTARISGNIPFILTYQNDLSKDGFVLKTICNLYYWLVGNRTLELADKIIVTSKYYAEISPYLKKHLNKIHIVPPGVNIKKFNPKVDTKSFIKKFGKGPKVLFVGQLDKTHIHKGLHYLIEAVSLSKKTIKDIKLIVVGNGDNIEDYKNHANMLGIKDSVIFETQVSDDNLPQYYAGTDVTVLPSYNNAEGFGMVLIEAGACGKPVIGTNVGGIPSVINDMSTGYLVVSKNAYSISSRIDYILNNPNIATELGNNALLIIKDGFIWKKNIMLTNRVLTSFC